MVLPTGYELVGVNHPSQVVVEEDGRVRVSFLNTGAAAVPYRVRGRPLPPGAATPTSAPQEPPPGHPGAPPATGRAEGAVARVGYTFDERAFQDREIVYYLLDPDTHAFRLWHDYTETRPGVGQYLNVVRAGSAASDPEAYLLDTGERLKVETLKGGAITQRGVDIGQPPDEDTEVVVIWFDPPGEGESRRLRIWETYTDPGRYLRVGDELIWDQTLRTAPKRDRPPGRVVPHHLGLPGCGIGNRGRPDPVGVLGRRARRGGRLCEGPAAGFLTGIPGSPFAFPYSPSSTSRTFAPSCRTENGFWINAMPSSRTPWCVMTSSVYPDIYRTFVLGNRLWIS